VPDRVRPLLTRVKNYERRTVAAALSPLIASAQDALAANPLVPNRATADRLIADLVPLW
jgi:alpha-galactosidase/6-phospho-beta-glucosidase family protein